MSQRGRQLAGRYGRRFSSAAGAGEKRLLGKKSARCKAQEGIGRGENMEFQKDLLDLVCIPRDALAKLLTRNEASIKVYLYGLMRSAAEAEQMAGDLGLTRAQVLEALESLQQAGLLAVEPDSGRVRYLLERAQPPAANPYPDREFNETLQALFSDRELSYSDYKVFYEILEVYGLSRPVILLLAEYCINTNRKGNRVSVSYIRQVAKAWAQEGIDTIEHAQMHMAALAETAGGAREVLRLLKINRPATDSEQELYQKWEKEWGFSFAAIKAACAATTSARYPSMKYLDGILKNMRQEGIATAAGVRAYLADHEAEDEQIKALLRAVSAPSLVVAPAHRKLYRRLLELGYGREEMLLACGQAVLSGKASLEAAGKILEGWHNKGLMHQEEILAYLAQQQECREKIAAMHAAAGVKKKITRADQALYEKFVGMGFGWEVILFAASCAYGAASPLKAMDAILSRWKQAGVRNLQEAQQQNARFKEGYGKKSISDIDERSYAKETMDQKIYDPIEEILKKQGQG